LTSIGFIVFPFDLGGGLDFAFGFALDFGFSKWARDGGRWVSGLLGTGRGVEKWFLFGRVGGVTGLGQFVV
jgi:hypothetical protein